MSTQPVCVVELERTFIEGGSKLIATVMHSKTIRFFNVYSIEECFELWLSKPLYGLVSDHKKRFNDLKEKESDNLAICLDIEQAYFAHKRPFFEKQVFIDSIIEELYPLAIRIPDELKPLFEEDNFRKELQNPSSEFGKLFNNMLGEYNNYFHDWTVFVRDLASEAWYGKLDVDKSFANQVIINRSVELVDFFKESYRWHYEEYVSALVRLGWCTSEHIWDGGPIKAAALLHSIYTHREWTRPYSIIELAGSIMKTFEIPVKSFETVRGHQKPEVEKHFDELEINISLRR